MPVVDAKASTNRPLRSQGIIVCLARTRLRRCKQTKYERPTLLGQSSLLLAVLC